MTERRENAYPAYLGNKDNWDMGMTLRDYFAGQALVGIIAQPNLESWDPAITAKWAYEIAGAMLEARK